MTPSILPNELIDQIIFAMENQEQSFVFDMEKIEVIPEPAPGMNAEAPDERFFVKIPRWTSADGYHLMEKFVAGINNPLYRQDLGQALSGGRGAFRRFKDALKSHGPLEKLWYSFKEREMRQTVREWLQGNEEAKNLAALGPEPDETEELVLIDFPLTVETFDGAIDEALIDTCFREAFQPEQPWLRELFGEECLVSLESGEELIRILITTPGGDFAAMAMLVRFDSSAGAVLKLPLLYVDVQFRGLGLAKLLIERSAEEARYRDIANLIVELPGESAVLLPFLEEVGFSTVRRSCSLNVPL